MGPEEGSLALRKLCGLAFVSRAQGRGGIGMMTTGVHPLGSFNVSRPAAGLRCWL